MGEMTPIETLQACIKALSIENAHLVERIAELEAEVARLLEDECKVDTRAPEQRAAAELRRKRERNRKILTMLYDPDRKPASRCHDDPD